MAKDVKSLSTGLEPFRHESELMKVARRALEPNLLAIKALQADSSVQRLIEDMRRRGDAMRAEFVPLQELSDSVKVATQALSTYRAHFELPPVSEAMRVFNQLQESVAAKEMLRFQEQSRTIQSAIESMRSPWLDAQNRLKSMGGFAELQSIGISLRTLDAFDDNLIAQLRTNLGDWRGTIKWPENVFIDAMARTNFYADMGFNASLTNFPTEAFAEGVSLAGLAANPPPLVEEYEEDQ